MAHLYFPINSGFIPGSDFIKGDKTQDLYFLGTFQAIPTTQGLMFDSSLTNILIKPQKRPWGYTISLPDLTHLLYMVGLLQDEEDVQGPHGLIQRPMYDQLIVHPFLDASLQGDRLFYMVLRFLVHRTFQNGPMYVLGQLLNTRMAELKQRICMQSRYEFIAFIHYTSIQLLGAYNSTVSVIEMPDPETLDFTAITKAVYLRLWNMIRKNVQLILEVFSKTSGFEVIFLASDVASFFVPHPEDLIDENDVGFQDFRSIMEEHIVHQYNYLLNHFSNQQEEV